MRCINFNCKIIYCWLYARFIHYQFILDKFQNNKFLCYNYIFNYCLFYICSVFKLLHIRNDVTVPVIVKAIDILLKSIQILSAIKLRHVFKEFVTYVVLHLYCDRFTFFWYVSLILGLFHISLLRFIYIVIVSRFCAIFHESLLCFIYIVIVSRFFVMCLLF